jgi:acyl carrier protein/polyketide biosynthesis acyl carrier protein
LNSKEREMTKDAVIEVIKKNIAANSDDIDAAGIDPQKSMKDYGANSLDMIEVVSTSMRELKIKVPRSELTDINNIEQLAEKFLEYVNKGNG